MNEEEKEAIETLKIISEFGGDNLLCREHRKKIDVVLNLIEKQQKEIEELKNIDLTMVYMDRLFDGEKKLKDKLREIIKEKAKTDTYNFKTIEIKDLGKILGE